MGNQKTTNQEQQALEVFEELEATPEVLAEMVQAKTKENTALTNENAKLQQELASMKNRAMTVFSENNQLKAIPSVTEEMAKMEYQLKLADYFIQGGAFPKELNAAKAFTLMKAGEEMGLSPIESLNGLYIINGKILPWGKTLTSQITKAGYRIAFSKETDKGVTVTVRNQATGHEVTESVTADDKSIANKQAIKAAPRQKLRYHALRMIASFHLAHLFGGSADMFNQRGEEQPEQDHSEHNIEKVEASKEVQRLFDHINRSKTLAQLKRVESHKSTHPEIIEAYDAKLAGLSKIEIPNE